MPKIILVIDDSESIRELVALTLESGGFEVKKAADGVEGLRLLDCNDTQLVIADLNMPVMDGIQLIREIRKKAAYTALPILVLTTELSRSKKSEAKAAGATGWVMKPFVQHKLLETVRHSIKNNSWT